MIKNRTLLAICCFAIAFINSCTNDVGSLEAGPTAAYTFTNTSSPVIAGIYAVNRQMDINNTITFTVNVTVRGKYSITTNAGNGVYFETGGVFTTTGPQTIILYGKGIPIKAGNFSFASNTGNSGNFTVSFLPYPPPAVFTFSGGTGACSPASIAGTYTGSIALNASNYVDITINVSSIGTYAIVTNTINNIFFTASGTFNAPGSQVVRLYGIGTPVAGGTFTYAPPGGCSFSITSAPPPPPAVFSYTCLPAVQTGTFAAGTALTTASTIKIGVIVTTAGFYSITTTSGSDNGVTFSGSGIVGSGPQVITLTSSNTPAAAGTFSYTPTGASCTFDVTYTTGGGGGGGGGGTPTMFLKATVGGVVTNFNNSLLVFADPAAGTFSVEGTNSDGGTDVLRINVTDMSNPLVAGNYNNFSPSNLNKGCQVLYNTSAFVTGINSNSFVVTFTSITANAASGTFSGTLYNNFGAGPGTKSVAAGSFSVTY